jgi:predicted transcriptional regulator
MPHVIRIPPRQPLLALLLSCAVVAPLMAAAPIYQWRDAKGVTHFGDTPPASARGIRVRQASAGNVVAASESEPAIDVAACERKRAQLKGYRQADQVTETNALGDVREYSDAERQVLIAGTEAQVRAACGEEAAAAP